MNEASQTADGQKVHAGPKRWWVLRRFSRASSGSVAVEFAIVSIPFFGILFAIIETALLFFVSQVLDSAITKASRQIRTGQAQQASMSKDQFKALVCNAMGGLSNCNANLFLDVRTYSTFSGIGKTSPIDEDKELDETKTVWQPGLKTQIVVVRGFYAWPTFFNFFGNNTAQLADGRRLLGAVVAFRNEPFPWGASP